MAYLLCFLLPYIIVALMTPLIHRLIVHSGGSVSGVGKFILRYGPVIFIGVDMIPWRIRHLVHHRESDTENDPHSPHFNSKGDFTLDAIVEKFKNGDRFVTKLAGTSPLGPFLKSTLLVGERGNLIIGLVCNFFLGLAISSSIIGGALSIIGLLVTLYLFELHTAITHQKGTQNFNTRDKSTNLPWSSLMLPGEGGYHNNHHAFPQSPKSGLLDGEFDTGWIILKFWEKVGLCKIYSGKIPSKTEINLKLNNKG